MGEGLTLQKKLDWIYAYMLRRDNDFENTDIQRKNFFVRRQEDEVDHLEDIIFLSRYKEFTEIFLDLQKILNLRTDEK